EIDGFSTAAASPCQCRRGGHLLRPTRRVSSSLLTTDVGHRRTAAPELGKELLHSPLELSGHQSHLLVVIQNQTRGIPMYER
ncbi:MAG: hypothetical protein WC681_22250, partial [Sterolibacterium sp.]